MMDDYDAQPARRAKNIKLHGYLSGTITIHKFPCKTHKVLSAKLWRKIYFPASHSDRFENNGLTSLLLRRWHSRGKGAQRQAEKAG